MVDFEARWQRRVAPAPQPKMVPAPGTFVLPRWPGSAPLPGATIEEARRERQAKADSAELEAFRYFDELAARHRHLDDPLKVRAAAARRVISALAIMHPEVLRSAVEAARVWPDEAPAPVRKGRHAAGQDPGI